MLHSAARPVRVWDLATRLFHWFLIGLIAAAWWTYHADRMAWHKVAGYAVIALLVFRLWWGWMGGQCARFSDFVRGPASVWRYLRGRAAPYAGHNPLGGLSVVALLTLTAGVALTGLFAIDQDGLEAGPFASLVTFDAARSLGRAHALAFDLLLALIALHLFAVVAYLAAGHNLIVPMITGRKRVAESVPAPRSARFASLVVGLALAGFTLIALWRADHG